MTLFKFNTKSNTTPVQQSVSRPASPVQTEAKPLSATADTLGETRPAAPNKYAGLKLTAKIAGGTIAGGGLTAFAVYGMIAAAPHIGALIGTIAAAPATIPILATIGAVLGAVAIVTVVRAIYKKVQKEKLLKANAEAVKRAAEAVTSEATPVSTPSVPEAAGSLRRTNSERSLTPTEASAARLVENNTPEQNAALLETIQQTQAGYDDYFASIDTQRETGTPEVKAEIARVEKEVRKAQAVVEMLASDNAVAV